MNPQAIAPSVLDHIRGRHSSGDPLLATVSGIASTTPTMIDWFARNTCVQIITTKSIEVIPNPGNREPVITQPEPGCFGNAVGLRNPGVETAAQELAELRQSWDRESPVPAFMFPPLLNVSLSASSAADFALLAERLSPAADMLELNLSCPHAADGFGAAIGSSREAIMTVTQAVKDVTRLPVFVKLTPNVEDIGAMALAAVEAGADGIVAINTVGPATYTEPDSGTHILTNAPGGRGGMSGLWIFDRAIDSVASIRAVVGPEVPVIGMGGVSSTSRMVQMCAAGADVVGIGSVLGTMHQREWPAFLAHLVPQPDTEWDITSGTADARKSRNYSEVTIPIGNVKSAGGYRRFTVHRVEQLEPTIVEITLRERLDVGPGQTVFLWLPGVGEKPYAAGLCDPLTIVVKIKGPHTQALSSLEPDDRIYIRGPYGDRHEPPGNVDQVVMVVAGTGIAAVSILAGILVEAGVPVKVLLGMRDPAARTPLTGDRTLQKVTQVVYDNGTEGAVLTTLADTLSPVPETAKEMAVYAVGPDQFVDRALTIARDAGLSTTYVSLERLMLCGVGLCGACSCGGELTCQYGTFVTGETLQNAVRQESSLVGAGND